MTSEIAKLKSRFAAGDAVQFKYRRRMVAGVVVRTNPKRAVVRVGGEEFAVPYELLVPESSLAAKRQRKIEAVHALAVHLIAQHGLDGWGFGFDDSTRRAGCCNYRDQRITIAFELARNGSDADIRDTVLHEIAHALVGRKHHHDKVWKAKARAIGCSGERTHKLQFSAPRWSVTCENRCWTHTAQQRNPRLICGKCGTRLVYSPHPATG